MPFRRRVGRRRRFRKRRYGRTRYRVRRRSRYRKRRRRRPRMSKARRKRRFKARRLRRVRYVAKRMHRPVCEVIKKCLPTQHYLRVFEAIGSVDPAVSSLEATPVRPGSVVPTTVIYPDGRATSVYNLGDLSGATYNLFHTAFQIGQSGDHVSNVTTDAVFAKAKVGYRSKGAVQWSSHGFITNASTDIAAEGLYKSTALGSTGVAGEYLGPFPFTNRSRMLEDAVPMCCAWPHIPHEDSPIAAVGLTGSLDTLRPLKYGSNLSYTRSGNEVLLTHFSNRHTLEIIWPTRSVGVGLSAAVDSWKPAQQLPFEQLVLDEFVFRMKGADSTTTVIAPSLGNNCQNVNGISTTDVQHSASYIAEWFAANATVPTANTDECHTATYSSTGNVTWAGFGNVGVADGNANPVDVFIKAQGIPLFKQMYPGGTRPKATLGIGLRDKRVSPYFSLHKHKRRFFTNKGKAVMHDAESIIARQIHRQKVRCGFTIRQPEKIVFDQENMVPRNGFFYIQRWMWRYDPIFVSTLVENSYTGPVSQPVVRWGGRGRFEIKFKDMK